MAALTITAATLAGVAPAAAAQISAWASTPDTIDGSIVGSRGVLAVVANSSGGSLDFRVGDPGFTPAGNPVAVGYSVVTVPNSASRYVFIGPNNVNSSGVVQVGASTTNAAFTVQLVRY